MGVAAVSWRSQCEANPNAGICFLSAPAASTTAASIVPKRAPTIPELAVEASAAPEPTLAASAATPAPAEMVIAAPAPAEAEMVAAAEMMNSTFATLSVLKAEINGSDPAPDPLQAAVTASVEEGVAATPLTAELPKPDPLGAPTKRTVKLIPISPTGTPVTSAASDAINAAEQDDLPRAVATQQFAAVEPDPSLEPMAFATAPTAVPAGTPARVLEVDDNLVNVRSAPSTDAEKLWVLKRGDDVQALAVAGDWVQVQITEDKVGWMLGEFLGEANLDDLPQEEQVAAVVDAPVAAPAAEPVVVDDAVAVVPPSGGDIRRVTGGGVNVRASASSSGEKLFALGPGEMVTVVETERGWLRVTDDQGRTGWLYEDFVTGA